ncbi:hypothetical protein HHI36_011669 [Cryptolaemus montrouzieri]|uniref:Uncharacterized protein n=1 Tax=Cryptolaemus montrouzieri TaxID=559131 RepID=A0ABD2MMB7_9CUCU
MTGCLNGLLPRTPDWQADGPRCSRQNIQSQMNLMGESGQHYRAVDDINIWINKKLPVIDISIARKYVDMIVPYYTKQWQQVVIQMINY